MTKTLLLMSPLLWLACSLPAHGGTAVWRCAGNVYSEVPCSDGRMLAGTDDARPAADVAAARAVAARQQRLAEELRNERLQREAAGRTLPPAGVKAVGLPRGKTGTKAEKIAARKAAGKAAAKAEGDAEKRPVKPTAAAAQRPAAADTWRAVAPASPRGRG